MIKDVLGKRATIINENMCPTTEFHMDDIEDAVLTYFIGKDVITFRLFANKGHISIYELLSMSESYDPVRICDCIEFTVPVSTFNFNYFFKYGLRDSRQHPIS